MFLFVFLEEQKVTTPTIYCGGPRLILQTDTHKAYVDARRYISKPILTYLNPTQVNVTGDAKMLPIGIHTIRYDAYHPTVKNVFCEVKVTVVGKYLL